MSSWTESRHGQHLSVWGFFTGVCSGSMWVSQVFGLCVWHRGRIHFSSCTAEHKHQPCWPRSARCVYVANCKLTCYGVRRGGFRASPVSPKMESTNSRSCRYLHIPHESAITAVEGSASLHTSTNSRVLRGRDRCCCSGRKNPIQTCLKRHKHTPHTCTYTYSWCM